MSSSAALTAVAVGLAVLDAGCFGLAAVAQHRGVRHTVGRPPVDLRPDAHRHRHRLDLAQLRSLLRRRSWLAGSALVLLGGLLHICALVLAPVSLIQPLGVLGVPVAVLAAARWSGHRPARAVALPIAGCVLSIAIFVWLAVGQDAAVPSTVDGLVITELVITALIVIFAVLARFLHGWSRCLCSAVAGAVGLGLTSALVRALAHELRSGPARLGEPVVWLMIIGLACSALIGGWLVQRAYASGPPEAVIACLTVVDPMVAVVIGFGLLGEGASLAWPVRIGMIACGLAAATAVVALARYHPESAHRRAAAVASTSQTDSTVPVDSAGPMIGATSLNAGRENTCDS